MYRDHVPQNVASGYQVNAMATLPDEQRLLKGIHGVAVYLKRATMTAGSPNQVKVGWAKHLSDADRLLAFLEGIVERDETFGTALIRCYQGIRRLILGALIADADSAELIETAYRQAHELESAIKRRITSHDQPT